VWYLRDPITGTVDDDGRVLLPAELVTKLGLRPGSVVPLDEEPDGIRVRRPADHLARVYVEPTGKSDPANGTDRATGPLMSDETFARILSGLETLDPMPAVVFGGSGEPLLHPVIVDMVRQAKAAGARQVELVTAGFPLTEDMARRLIDAGMDTLWVSPDGGSEGGPESSPADDGKVAPPGALPPQVFENLERFEDVRREIQLPGRTPEERRRYGGGHMGLYEPWRLPEPKPTLGLVFVATSRSIAGLPNLIGDTYRLRVKKYLVTNVCPSTSELAEEIVSQDRLRVSPFPTLWSRSLRLTPMDINDTTREPLTAAVDCFGAELAREDVSNVTRRCPFVEAGSVIIGWSGEVTPCLRLSHAHDEFVDGRPRSIAAHPVGDLGQATLLEIWSSAAYAAFRQRVQAFEFDADSVCGGCLWSRGLIRCP
jgi:Fe-coproporphyrin III synthase